MITLIHRSYKMGLFTATHGTYSVRLSDGSFLITPFGFDRAYLEEDDLVRVKGGMKELGKTPSRAVLLHQKIYEQHPDVGAILLAHPVHAMAFAVTDAAFDARTIPKAISSSATSKRCRMRRSTGSRIKWRRSLTYLTRSPSWKTTA
ncbi:MAG: class II aldolase/adducin family protein [Acutalibacteraceae bacterium]